MSKYQALIDALAYAKFTGGTGITASVADLDSLLADLERAEKDAERYRALRDGQSPLSVGRHVSVCDEYPRYEEVNWLHESELDAAIDAALSQLKGVQ